MDAPTSSGPELTLVVAYEACEIAAELFGAGQVDSVQGSQFPVGDASSPIQQRWREMDQMGRFQQFVTTPALRHRQMSHRAPGFGAKQVR